MLTMSALTFGDRVGYFVSPAFPSTHSQQLKGDLPLQFGLTPHDYVGALPLPDGSCTSAIQVVYTIDLSLITRFR